MKKPAILGAIAMVVACVGSAFGTTWYVSPSGDGSDPSAGFATGYATIKAAITAASAGDTLILDKVTFSCGKGRTNPDEMSAQITIDKQLTITGAGTPEETIIDGGEEYARRIYDGFKPGFNITGEGVVLKNMTFERMGHNQGQAIIIDGKNSVVSNMVFRNNGWGYTTNLGGNNGLIQIKKGLLSGCIITNNSLGCSMVSIAGGLDKNNGAAENCYIANNTCTYASASQKCVVSLTGAAYQVNNPPPKYVTFRHNTVVNNTTLGPAVYHSSVNFFMANNIIWGNKDADGNDQNLSTSNANRCSDSCIKGAGSIANLVDCFDADPMFDTDNMHLKSASSPCYQKANAKYTTAVDIDGNVRDAKPCIGCCEYVNTTGYSCEIKASADKVMLPDTVTLTAEITGTPSGVLTYAWDFDGDGEVDSTEASPVLNQEGKYNVSVTLKDKGGSGNPVIATYDKCISVYGEGKSNFTYYVSPTGTGKNPVAGFATGYPTLKLAFENADLADGDTILLDKATFDLSPENAVAEINYQVSITKRIVVSGVGAKEETILDGGRETNADGTNWDRRWDNHKPGFVLSANGIVFRNMTFERMGSNGHTSLSVPNNVTDCVISNMIFRNTGHGYASWQGLSTSVGTGNQNTHVSCCVFTNNVFPCAVVSMTGGSYARMDNCYFADNTCTGEKTDNGVVAATYGSHTLGMFCNNTIVNNKSKSGALYHNSYYTWVTVANCITYGNKTLDGTTCNNYRLSSTDTTYWMYNCIEESDATVFSKGTGNIFSLPGFAADNFHLKAGSLCIGAASPKYATSHDIDGVERNAEKPCIGCSEYVDTSVFTCAIAAPSAMYVVQPATMTFTASVDGEAVEPVKYEWDVDGDGTYDRCTNEVVLSAVGEYVISVKATDAKGNEATSALEGKRYIYPADKTFYVTCKPNPAAKPPYDGWSSAANSLNDVCEHAYKFDSSRIVLDDGVHTVSTTVVLTNGMVVASVNGRDKTVVTTLDKDRSMFKLNDPNAVLEGVTLTSRAGNIPNCEGSAVLLSSGTFRDSMITNWNSYGSGMISTRGCTAARPSAIERCIFADCTGTATNAIPGVYLVSNSKVTLENCLFSNIVTKWPGTWSWNLGSALNCASSEAVIRNCTFATNDCVSCYPLHITTEPKVFENNILFGNTTNGTFAANDVVLKDAYNKDRGVVSTVAYTCVTDGERDYSKNVGVITANPGFVDAEDGDYHLLRNVGFKAACIGKGVNNGVYDADSIDLDGNKRLVGHRVDMGCYECQTEYGTQMILR